MTRKLASFIFTDSLNDFLPAARRECAIQLAFQGEQSVKHLFESCGVPHVEVGRVFANDQPVSQAYLVQDGDGIVVHPYALPIQAPARFVLDNHLGKLAAYMRLLGLDVAYRNDFQDEELAAVSSQEGRILLTRDRRLLMRTIVTQGYCVRSLQPRQQALEILSRYDLQAAILPFGRCVHCNARLEPVEKAQVLERLEPLTRKYFDEFQRCPQCEQVYWKGSHYERMLGFIESLIQAAAHAPGA